MYVFGVFGLRGKFCGVSSFFSSLCGFWGLNSEYQVHAASTFSHRATALAPDYFFYKELLHFKLHSSISKLWFPSYSCNKSWLQPIRWSYTCCVLTICSLLPPDGIASSWQTKTRKGYLKQGDGAITF